MVFSIGQTVLCIKQQYHLFHFFKKLAKSIGYTKICLHAQPATIRASILYPSDPTSSNFEPARLSPSKFWTRPIRPVRRKICPQPPLPVRLPYPSGRIGSGCSLAQYSSMNSFSFLDWREGLMKKNSLFVSLCQGQKNTTDKDAKYEKLQRKEGWFDTRNSNVRSFCLETPLVDWEPMKIALSGNMFPGGISMRVRQIWGEYPENSCIDCERMIEAFP